MAITNNKIEFDSWEKLNEYLNDSSLTKVDYIISKIGDAWTVTVPLGYYENRKFVERENFDATNGIEDDNVWHPATDNKVNSIYYVNIIQNTELTEEAKKEAKKLTESKLSGIRSVDFVNSKRITDSEELSEVLKNYRGNSSYFITRITAY